MLRKVPIQFLCLALAVLCHSTHAQYLGGIGDGIALDATCNTDLDGTTNSLTIGSISGSAIFCNNSSETFSINITNGTADTYLWTGPTGTTVISQQIDGYANLLFGTTSGNVSVEVSNACSVASTNLAVTNSACAFYSGGSDDGSNTDASCNTTLDGVGTGLTISSITGSAVFCDNSAETYAITVTNGAADNYLWTGPTGTTVNSQQIDGYASLLFGTTSGNVSVQVSNACATVTENLAVTNSACAFYSGGNDDGTATDASCNTTLNGVGAGLSISAISGPSIFCDNSAETYSITVTNGTAENFLWTGPTGMTVNSQQIDGFANLLFGNTAGTVTVQASNACATVSENIAVTNSSCGFFFGGNDDGTATDASCNTTLNGVGAGLSISGISGSSVFCENSAETYSVMVTNGAADNFLWTGPTGTTVNSQQIDGYASLLFGNTAGNVTVQASNACASVTENVAVTNSACSFFFGGNNDGSSTDASCNTTLDGVGTGLTISAISGSSVFCDNSAETYSVTVTNGAAENFLWTGPTGMTVNSQQIDGYASLLFGTTAGTVTVEASNACATVTENLAVTNSGCTYFYGGDQDGNDSDASCNTTLDGVGAGLSISSISGPSSFCEDNMESYSVVVTAGIADNFLWTGPSGFTILSQQIDGFVNMLMGSTAGNVTVEVSNACASVSENIAVTNTACEIYRGGNSGGLSNGESAMSIGLPITLVSFSASYESPNMVIEWVTASEIDNDFFTIERSENLSDWYPINKTDGAGNSIDILHYQFIDKDPVFGISYYRLRQTDFDGTTTHSDAFMVNIGSSFEQTIIYPVPTSDKLTVKTNLSNAVIAIYNTQGQYVYAPIRYMNESYELDLTALEAGIYYIRINDKNGIQQNRKIIVL